MQTPKFLYVALTLTALAACGTRREVLPGGEAIVDRSLDSRPDWLNQRFQEKGTLYIVIGNEHSRDRGLGEDGAKLNAMMNIGGSYLSVLNELVGHGKTEIPDELAKTLKSTADIAARNVPISGAITKEIYWEKIERSSYGEIQYYYDVWVMVQISPDGYQRGLRYAVDKLKTEASLGQDSLDKIKEYEDRMKSN